MGKIVGIDLGTSTSEISIINEGKPFVIPNKAGDFITPSIVAIDENGEIVVGTAARELLRLSPENAVIEVKRLMGSGKNVTLGNNTYSPQEISSFIIKHLVKYASEYIGSEIDRAVISVPAYFSDEQRKATVDAGKLAGLKVERIINEPTAAALDYGLENMKTANNIMVYDLGGGTLDVTVLEMFEGVLEVKASCGNNSLGGKDFDQCLMDYISNSFFEQYPSADKLSPRSKMLLKQAAEECKIGLSKDDVYEIQIPFFSVSEGLPIALNIIITREIFENLISPLIESTAAQIDRALSDSKLSVQDIDVVLLVGGSTRIPYVKKFLESHTSKMPQTLLDPDLAVTKGAAIQSGILDNVFSSEVDILITDVCPYTLGTSVLSYVGGFPDPDVYDVIIPRNVTIPTVRKKTYFTVSDNQIKVKIDVYQGEYKKASKNNFLGDFILDGIPPAPAAKEPIIVSFSYDANGILSVEAMIQSTGKSSNIQLETTGVEMLKELDVSGWKNHPKAKKYRALINKANRLLEIEYEKTVFTDIAGITESFIYAIVNDEPFEVLDKYFEQLTDEIFEIEDADE